MEMIIEFLRKSLPVPDGCCGVEFPNESEEFEKALMRILEEETGRKWINTLSLFEDMHGNRLIVYHFPRNLRRAERLGVKRLPALVAGHRVVIEGDATCREIRKKLREAVK
jgi:ADP-ribose pyrophosphatase YjhB (NUDIX family)